MNEYSVCLLYIDRTFDSYWCMNSSLFWLIFYSLKMMTKGVIWNSNICSRLKKAASPPGFLTLHIVFYVWLYLFREILDSILNIMVDDVTLFTYTQKRVTLRLGAYWLQSTFRICDLYALMARKLNSCISILSNLGVLWPSISLFDVI
jgi:hypothetical protein